MDQLHQFLISTEGMALTLFSRLLISSIFLCLGTHLFDFKRLVPFFTFKRVLSVFFFLMGLRIFYGAMVFFL